MPNGAGSGPAGPPSERRPGRGRAGGPEDGAPSETRRPGPPSPLPARPGPGAVGAGKALEGPLLLLQGDAGAVIGHVELPAVVSAPCGDPHAGTIGRVANGVVQEVVDYPPRETRIRHRRAGLRHLDLDL